jgi:RNA polymerase sigma-70 factor (ECF subfamily)
MNGVAAKLRPDDRLTNLALRAARGDRQAFDEFWTDQEWLKFIDHKCRRICRVFPMPGRNSACDAEDLRQRACVQAFKALPQFRGEAKIQTWFNTIATNLRLRDYERQCNEAKASACSVWLPMHDLSHDDPYSAAALMEAYRSLSPRERKVYELLLQGKTAKEIAQEEVASLPDALRGEAFERKLKEIYKIRKQVQMALVKAI